MRKKGLAAPTPLPGAGRSRWNARPGKGGVLFLYQCVCLLVCFKPGERSGWSAPPGRGGEASPANVRALTSSGIFFFF